MIDYFALALTHGLLVMALLRLLKRGDLDREAAAPPVEEAAPGETRREARERRRRRA